MELTISLNSDSETKLRQRAAASGEDMASYISQLLKSFTEPPTPIEELSGPTYQAFLSTGMTDDQLADELERAKHDMRRDHHHNGI